MTLNVYLRKIDIKENMLLSLDNGEIHSYLRRIENKIFFLTPIGENCINKHTVCIRKDMNKVIK